MRPSTSIDTSRSRGPGTGGTKPRAAAAGRETARRAGGSPGPSPALSPRAAGHLDATVSPRRCGESHFRRLRMPRTGNATGSSPVPPGNDSPSCSDRSPSRRSTTCLPWVDRTLPSRVPRCPGCRARAAACRAARGEPPGGTGAREPELRPSNELVVFSRGNLVPALQHLAVQPRHIEHVFRGDFMRPSIFKASTPISASFRISLPRKRSRVEKRCAAPPPARLVRPKHAPTDLGAVAPVPDRPSAPRRRGTLRKL